MNRIALAFVAFMFGMSAGVLFCIATSTDPRLEPKVDSRLVTIRVEEDGSYPAGCLPGWYCDDTRSTP